MGLDAVELVIETEEAFQIRIDDRDAEKIVTVGQLHDFIIERLPPDSPWQVTPAGESVRSTPCLEAAAFYRLRRAFKAAGCNSCSQISPSTSLVEALPIKRRRRLWKSAQAKLGWQLPQLCYSKATLQIFTIVSPCIAAAVSWYVFADLRTLVSTTILGGLGVFVVMYAALSPLAVHFEHGRSFADLSRWVVMRNHEAVRKAVGSDAQLSVWSKLVGILSHQLGIDPAIIKPKSSFVNDLGLS
jgi:acyl carrier protein